MCSLTLQQPLCEFSYGSTLDGNTRRRQMIEIMISGQSSLGETKGFVGQFVR